MGNIRLVDTYKADLTTTAYTALPQKIDRKFIWLKNTHASQFIFVTFGEVAASNTGFHVGPGQILTFPVGDNMCPVDYMSVYGSAASTSYHLVEGF